MGELGSEKGRVARGPCRSSWYHPGGGANFHAHEGRCSLTIHENQSHERCHLASQTGQEGSDKQPSQEVGTQALCGAVLLSVLSTVWPLRTTAQQLPQTKSTHPSYLGKLLLGIYLADAHVAKVSARMVTTALFMCQKIRTTSCPTDEGLEVSSGMRGGGPQVQPQPKPQPTFTQCYYDQFQPSSSRSA